MRVRPTPLVLVIFLLLALVPSAQAHWPNRESAPLIDTTSQLQLPFPTSGTIPGPGTIPGFVPPPGPADLVITVVDTPDPILPNDILTYNLMVTNIGRGDARATALRLDVPAGTGLNALGPGCYLHETAVWCQVPPLLPGAKVSFTIQVEAVTPMGAITTLAVIDPANLVFEMDKANNAALTTTIVGRGTPGTSPTFRPQLDASAPTPRVVAAPAFAPTPTGVPAAVSVPVVASVPAPVPQPAQSVPALGTIPGSTGSAAEQWLLILAPADVYLIREARIDLAPTGAWYKVLLQEGGWALASREGEAPVTAGWIEIDDRVQSIAGPRRLPSAPIESWLEVLAPTQVYSTLGSPEFIAGPGERYRIISQDRGWALAIGEEDTPSRTIWIELDSRVQISGADLAAGSVRR